MSALYEGIHDGYGENDVKRLQSRLIELGYMIGTFDGVFGAETSNAVRYFQTVNGLDVTGVADYDTLAKLYSDRAVMNPAPTPTPFALGVVSDDVSVIQKALIQYGFLDEAPDGNFGARTDTAVREAQQYMFDRQAAYESAHPTKTPQPTRAWMTPTPTPTHLPTPVPTATPENYAVNTWSVAQRQTPSPTPSVRPTPTRGPRVPDGVVTEELIKWLVSDDVKAYNGTVQNGDKTPDALRVQRRLVSLGYMRKSDGAFGNATERCLKYFQKKNGLAETGVVDESTWNALYSPDAERSDTIVTQYRIRVSTDKQRVYVYEWNGSNFSNHIKTFKCSTGLNATPTPKGTFWATGPRTEWYYFKEFDCWARYAWTIDGGILFHSVIYSSKSESSLRRGTVSQLGRKASHGCVRLAVEDAKWIFKNCPAGTPVIVE